MKERIKHLLLPVLLLSATLAQAAIVTGVVTGEDGSPAAGVNVVAKGTNFGVITGIDGRYSIDVPEGVTALTFSSLEYATQEKSISGSEMNVAMTEGTQSLDEVVVTAMGISRSQRTLGYAATTVSGDNIAQMRSTDAMSTLSGKVAGVQVSAAGSDPGAANSIIIRGVSSLNGSNQPLFIVDGVPIVNNVTQQAVGSRESYSLGNGASMVSPDNIANLTVLKGAAATALYGSRAANGVILITTKSGNKNTPLSIEVNSGVQISSVNRLPELQNTFGQGWYGLKTDNENGSWGPAFDGKNRVYGPIYNNSQLVKEYKALPNNLRDFFENGVMYSNSVSASGGSDNATYHAAFSNINDNGMMPGDKDKHEITTVSFRNSYSYDKWLDLSSSVNIANQETHNVLSAQGTSVIDGLYELPRDISIVDLKDLNNPFNSPGYYFTPFGITNPYYALEHNMAQYKQNKVYGKFQADFHPIQDLTFTYRFGFDYTSNERKVAMPKLDLAGTPNSSVTQEGFVEVEFGRRHELNHDFFAVYNKEFLEDFEITATAGININERASSYTNSRVSNLSIPTFYDLSNTAALTAPTETASKRRLMGLFGDVQLGYKNMVFLGLTARNDWSSTLPIDNNDYFYPGVTGSFVFTELIPANEILTFGKLRLAWGKTGNDANVYLTNPGFAAGYARNQYSAETEFPIGGMNGYKLVNTLGSMNLQPEMTTEAEVGINLHLFKGRVGVDAAYYNRASDKQIFALNMDPATGYLWQTTNLGKISNKGVELLLTTVPVKTKDFTWGLDFNFSKNNSKVESLPEELGGRITLNQFTTSADAVYMYAEVGKPVGTFWTLNTEKDPNGNVVADPNTGMPINTKEPVYSGYDMNSKWEGGVSTSLSYKGFSVAANLDIRVGGYMFSRTKDLMAFTGNGKQTLYNNRYNYIIPGSVNKIDNGDDTYSYVENTTPVTSSTVADGSQHLMNGFDHNKGMLLERTFTKLRNLTVSYDLPESLISRIHLKGVRISLVGNNLFIWTPKENIFIDPETTTEGIDLDGKFGELYVNPSSRRLGFNLQIKF